MNSKRSRNKIYKWVDGFFILGPLLAVIGYFIFCFLTVSYSSYSTGQFNTFYEVLLSCDYGVLFDVMSSNINTLFLDGAEFSSSFINSIYSLVHSILNFFFEWLADPFGLYFLEYYFTWVIFYELFSLFINVILWLVRYIRNWVQEKTDTMI